MPFSAGAALVSIEALLTADPLKYRERTYRHRIFGGDLVSFQVQVKETDLFISARQNLSDEAFLSIYRHRHSIEEYIKFHPDFLTSFVPLEADPFSPPIVREMLDASLTAGVGPMASIAGAIAQFVGLDLLAFTDEVVVENGGDIFIKSSSERRIAIFSGESPLSEKVFLKISPEDTPIGVCTSSATVGPSISLGRADAVCILSRSAVLADAAATAVGNTINRKEDIRNGLEMGMKIPGVLGLVIIFGEQLGAMGSVELT